VAVCWLLLVAAGRDYAAAGHVAASQFQGLGTLLLKADDHISPVSEIVFSLGVQEMVMAVWLIVRGLDPSAFAAAGGGQVSTG
jgi:hypothetical protein